MMTNESKTTKAQDKQCSAHSSEAGAGAAQLKPIQKSSNWCKRDGHNRICLACGKNAKSDPNGCMCLKHAQAFESKRRYRRAYFQKHKQRLVAANLHYRRHYPGARKRMREYARKWYGKNRQRKLAQNRVWSQKNAATRQPYFRRKALEWYYRNHKHALARIRRYYFRHKTEKNSRRNELQKAARANDPGKRIRYNFRTRLSTLLRKALRRKGQNKSFSVTRDVLTYTGDQLCAHLENQFTSEMNWGNYASYWEVDHITECERFDLTDLQQCRTCFALANLRPLSIQSNRSRYHAERREARLAKLHLSIGVPQRE